MYDRFALFYDRLMADVDYAAWADLLESLLTRCDVPADGKVCECACGTGSLTIPLARKGYRICGVDLSPGMLSAAMDKTRRQGLIIPYVRQDMSSLRLNGAYDAVLCTCDGVNYLSPDRLQRFFSAAARSLRDRGALVFDVSTPWKLRHALGNRTLVRNEEDYSYIWENRLSGDETRVSLRLIGFIRSGENSFERFVEEQVQYLHSRAALKALLEQSGFGDICFYGKSGAKAPSSREERWHVTARRIFTEASK